jgi:hypothetical protein
MSDYKLLIRGFIRCLGDICTVVSPFRFAYRRRWNVKRPTRPYRHFAGLPEHAAPRHRKGAFPAPRTIPRSKADAAKQIAKAGKALEWFESRVGSQENQQRVALLVSFIEPFQCLLVFPHGG